jgi:hypothetical protein
VRECSCFLESFPETFTPGLGICGAHSSRLLAFTSRSLTNRAT